MAERAARSFAPALPTVLFADASEDYRAMAADALLEGSTPIQLRFAENGGELMRRLEQEQRPALILLDAALPGTPGGLDAVRSIKSNSSLRRIPVVVLTTDPDPALVARAYDAGANTLIAKPVTFLALVKVVKVFTAYWLETAELPPATEAA